MSLTSLLLLLIIVVVNGVNTSTNILDGLWSDQWLNEGGNITNQEVSGIRGGTLCPKTGTYWTCNLLNQQSCKLHHDLINVTLNSESTIIIDFLIQAATEDFPSTSLSTLTISIELLDSEPDLDSPSSELPLYKWSQNIAVSSYSVTNPRPLITPVGLQYQNSVSFPNIIPSSYLLNFTISVTTNNSRVIFSGEAFSLKIENQTTNTTVATDIVPVKCISDNYTVALSISIEITQGFISQGSTFKLQPRPPMSPTVLTDSGTPVGSFFFILQKTATGLILIAYHNISDLEKVTITPLNLTLNSKSTTSFKLDSRTTAKYTYTITQINLTSNTIISPANALAPNQSPIFITSSESTSFVDIPEGVYPHPASKPTQQNDIAQPNYGLWVGLPIGLVAIVIIAVALFILFWRKWVKHHNNNSYVELSNVEENIE